MRPRKPIGEHEKEALRELLGKVKTKADFRRVQCVWLRAALDLSSSDTATAVGWRPGTVRVVQSQYFKQGPSVLVGQGRGGRRHENLSREQEKGLLATFLERAKEGGVLVVSEVKAAYEKAVGHSVPKSTVYRMLARNGWRKITPRRHHPKSNAAQQEAFKKNSRA